MEEAFEGALARARGGGEIPVYAGGDPKALARFLVSTLHVQAADDRRRSGPDAAGEERQRDDHPRDGEARQGG